MENILQLGGNIELSGFEDVDRASMVVLKKIIGNYARKFSNSCADFQKLALAMKPVHITDGSQKFEVHGRLMDGSNTITSEVTERNLFVVIDNALKKLESGL